MSAISLLETLTASGVRLLATGDKLKIDAPTGALTEELKAGLAAYKMELLSLLMTKPCANCQATMLHVEAGYYTCPNCHAQSVEARSTFWTTAQPTESANHCPDCNTWLRDDASCPTCDAARAVGVVTTER